MTTANCPCAVPVVASRALDFGPTADHRLAFTHGQIANHSRELPHQIKVDTAAAIDLLVRTIGSAAAPGCRT
jgi:hypothetical protein